VAHEQLAGARVALDDVEYARGTPASAYTSASSVAVRGVSSAGLKIIALPHASAGADFQHAIWIG
jgi:hypothetical protein